MSLPSSQPGILSALTQRFINRTVDVESFGHVEHVQVAYDLLVAYDYFDAVVL